MSGNELLGFLGGALTSLALVPQAWRLFKLKSAQEISLPFSLLLLAGLACWLLYGLLLHLPPVILWNSVSLVLTGGLVFAKLKYGR